MEEKNIVALIGTVKATENIKNANGMPFKGRKIVLETKRPSGIFDEVIVLAEKEVIETVSEDANVLAIIGSLQTVKNMHTGKVLVYVLANQVQQITGENWLYENEVELCGTIGSGTVYRETPNGRKITDLFIKVPCIKKATVCFIPCIAWEKHAKEVSELPKGELISVKGRLQSRLYKKVMPDGNVESRQCFELSIAEVESEEQE